MSKSDLIRESKESLETEYDLVKTLGSGTFSQVYLALHKASGDYRAIKKIRRSNFTTDQTESVLNEIAMLKQIDHPNIMKIFTFTTNERFIFLVTEYFKGEDLLARIEKTEKFTEAKAKKIMRQLFLAVAYLHSKGIVHRDLKPENIMFESPEENSNLKIIDFGTSKKVTDNQSMKALMGTIYYVAPEVLNRNYGKECDLWSLGVILYTLLCGYPPFYRSSESATYEIIKKGEFSFPPENWRTVSDSVKDLIKCLLNKDPAARITAEKALNHEWFKTTEKDDVPLKNEFFKLRKLTALQHAMGMYFVNFFGINEERKEMEEAFRKADEDHSGGLSRIECTKIFNMIEGWRPGEINTWILAADLDGSNTVDYSEFTVACMDFRKELNNKEAKKVFNSFDRDGNGVITPQELLSILGEIPGLDLGKAKQIIQEADKNKDGQISFDEFINAMDAQLSP